jgi:hypothetical protein
MYKLNASQHPKTSTCFIILFIRCLLYATIVFFLFSFNDINTTAAIRVNNPSISKACAAFQALVHHGTPTPTPTHK